MIQKIQDERPMRALTGIKTEKFSTLEAAFAMEDDVMSFLLAYGISSYSGVIWEQP